MLTVLATSVVGWLLHPDLQPPLTRGAPVLLLVVMAIVFADSGLLVGFFLPGDSLLFSAGLLAATSGGRLNVAVLVAGSFLAAFAGEQVGYWFGTRVGPTLFGRPDSRFFKQDQLTRSREFFDRHGPRALVLARFVPVVRTCTPVLAGVSAMRWRTFVTYNLAGAAAWSTLATLLGWGLGTHFSQLGEHLTVVLALIVAVSLVPILVEYRRTRRGTPDLVATGMGASDE